MKRIVLFDGECNFCDATVQFIMKHDSAAKIHFASLQSEIGQQLLAQFQLPNDLATVVFVEGDKAYTRSTAALKIARQLNGLWKYCYVAIIVPKPLRDLVYRYVAKNRYKWFGKKEACMLPTNEQRSRFL